MIAHASADDGIDTVDEVVPTRLHPEFCVQLVVKQTVVLEMEPAMLEEDTEQPTYRDGRHYNPAITSSSQQGPYKLRPSSRQRRQLSAQVPLS